jgi:hypothetical protein
MGEAEVGEGSLICRRKAPNATKFGNWHFMEKLGLGSA